MRQPEVPKRNSPKPDAEAERRSVERSMRLSLWDGGFYGLMTGITQNILAPFALLLNASNFLISLLTTLPHLAGSAFQLLAASTLKLFTSSKRYLVLMLALQTLSIALIPVTLLVHTASGHLALVLLLAFVTTTATFSLMANPVWMSYIGDLVPERKRNSFFGTRTAVIAAATFLTTILAGLLLKGMAEHAIVAFVILYGLAALFRLVSTLCVAKSRDHAVPKMGGKVKLREFLARVQTDDFGRFVTFTVLVRFGSYIAAPFFVVYELNVLQLDYLTFMLLQAASVVTSFLTMRAWAWLADHRGSRRVLVYSTLLIATIPLLWIVAYFYGLTNAHWPVFLVFEMWSGLSWAGFNLATSSYMLEASTPADRTKLVSYYNLFNNSAIFIAGLAGAAILKLYPGAAQVAEAFIILFAVSAVFRFAAWLFARPRLRELRYVEVPVERRSNTFVLSILPREGVVPAYFTHPTPPDIKQGVELRFEKRHELDQLREQLTGGDMVQRMKPRERDLYTKKFVERTKKK